MILQRKIIAILRHERHYYYEVSLVEDACFLLKEEENQMEDKLELSLSSEEELVFDLKYHQGKPAREIACFLNLDIKKTYNILYALKQKLRKQAQQNYPNNN
jgi:DNA-directed RNA polymerase specialized sigma24 family protein